MACGINFFFLHSCLQDWKPKIGVCPLFFFFCVDDFSTGYFTCCGVEFLACRIHLADSLFLYSLSSLSFIVFYTAKGRLGFFFVPEYLFGYVGRLVGCLFLTGPVLLAERGWVRQHDWYPDMRNSFYGLG